MADIDTSYRDRYNVYNQYTNSTDSAASTEKVWNAVFTDEKDMGVTVDDFLSLMVTQLQNQDFMNPVDDTQYVTQLAQFASMQSMQELASYMKTNYVMSLVGKNVTAATLSISGELQKETGMVQKISLVDNEYTIYVNDRQFSLEEIMEINSGSGSSSSGSAGNSGDQVEYLLSLMDREVTVRARDEEGEPAHKVKGYVEKVSHEDGYQLMVDGEWYPLEDLLEVGAYLQSEEDL